MADAKVTFETELDTSGLEAGINQLERKGLTTLDFGTSKDSLTKLGTHMGQIIGAKIALEIAKAIGATGMAFDSAISQVAATMGTTVSQIKPLEDLARAMGETGLFTAVEAAEALNYLALAGWDVEQILAGFPDMLTLAAAGNMNLANASDIVTDVITAMGLSVEDTTALVDQMATANNESNLTVKQLGQSMLELGATGRIVEGGTAELSTVLGLLANNGIKGSKAGRQLRNIITALAAPTKKATNAMDALGVSAYDSEGNFRPLVDIFADLNAAMAGFTEEQRTVTTREIFNKEDLKSANALLNTSRTEWEALNVSIENSGGAGSRMAETMLDNFGGDYKKLTAAVEGAKLEVYDAVEPMLRTMTQLGTTAVKNTVAPIAHYNDLMGYWNTMREDAETTLNDPNVQKLLAPPDDLFKPLTVSPAELFFTPQDETSKKSFWDSFVDFFIPTAGAEEMKEDFNPTAQAYAGAWVESVQNALRETPVDLQTVMLESFVKPTLTETDGEEGETNFMKDYANRITDALSSSVLLNFGDVDAAISTGLSDAATNADTSQFSSVGAQIAGGIAKGISNGTSVVVAAVNRLIQKALEAAESAAEIQSPSRLFASRIGEPIAAGTAVGVSDNAWKLAAAVGAMVKQSASTAELPNFVPVSMWAGSSASVDRLLAAVNRPEVPQTINFNVPVQTPDEFAKTMRLYATYGLQGD